MGAPEGRDTRLSELEGRIRAAREAGRPEVTRSVAAEKYNAASTAWRMVIELVVGVLIGAAMGWGLDWVFGSRPIFLIVFVLLGFAAGVRTVMRSADEVNRRLAAEAAAAKSDDAARKAAGTRG